MIPITIPKVDVWALAPVSLVIVTGIVALLIEMFRKSDANGPIAGVSLLGLAAAGWAAAMQFAMKTGDSFGGMIHRDAFGTSLQLALLGTCALVFLFSGSYMREKQIAFAEFYPLALWSTAGAMIMVSTQSLLMLFLGLEVLSIALYCLAGMSRNEQRSQESAMKYFLLGAYASSFLLFGIALIFGATGSVSLRALEFPAVNDQAQILQSLGIVVLLVGLGFKAALVPFHQWTPDVYQGAPTQVTAFMAGASKIGAFGALARVLMAAYPQQDVWFNLMFWIAILTMSVGNLVALRQKDVKRVLGYSSIAHAGYLVVGLLAVAREPERIGLGTVVFYLVGYSLMTIGAFAVVSSTARGGQEGTRLQDLYGLWKRSPYAAGALVVFVASLIGVPPTAGFVGKLMIFQDALTARLPALAIILAINSAISAYYYLGILKAVFIEPEGVLENRSAPASFSVSLSLSLCVAGVFAASLLVAPLQAKLTPTTPPALIEARKPPPPPEPVPTGPRRRGPLPGAMTPSPM